MPVSQPKQFIGCRGNRHKKDYSMYTSAYTYTSDNTSPSFLRTSESPPHLSELRAYYTYLTTMSIVILWDSAKNMNKTVYLPVFLYLLESSRRRQFPHPECQSALKIPLASPIVLPVLFPSFFPYPAKSLMTSPAMIRPATEGTNAVEPGISRRTVHFRVPGGQMQWLRQLIAGSSSGRTGCSVE